MRSAIGCVFSVALSLARNRNKLIGPVGVTHHRVLSCSDFPLRKHHLHRSKSIGLGAIVSSTASYDGMASRVLLRDLGLVFDDDFSTMDEDCRIVTSTPPEKLFDTSPENASEKEASASEPLRVLVWMNPEQVAFAQAVADQLQMDIILAGSDGAVASSTVSNELQTERIKDFRHQVLDTSPDLVWLLTTDGLAEDELAILAQERTQFVLTHEPILTRIIDCAAVQSIDHVHFIPLLKTGHMMKVFDDLRESFGHVRSVGVTSRGNRQHGSLYARLFGAVDVVEYLCGPIEQIDAAMSGPLGEPSATLPGLHGHLTLNARFTENCCASVQVSDLGAAWSRGVTILGEGGCIRLTDTMLEWWDAEGKLVDSSTHQPAPEAFLKNVDATLYHIVIDEINAIRRSSRRGFTAESMTRTIAVCESALLSLRTGQGESPRKLMQLAGPTH